MIGKILWLLATLLLTHAHLVEAQQPVKVAAIGWLSPIDTTSGQSRLISAIVYVEGW